jgi:hypothetical protein
MTGGGVLFNAVDGRLYALNPAAGLSWLCIRDGLSRPESISALANAFHIERPVAAEWLDASTTTFRTLGLLGNGAETATNMTNVPLEPPATLWSGAIRSDSGVDYRLFEQLFRIAAPLDIHPAINSLLGNLRIDGSAHSFDAAPLEIDIIARDHMWEIAVNRRLEVACESALVVAELERILLQAVVPLTPHLLSLHAAALQHNGRTFLLAGPSGSGKTTLSVALARAGWRFASDELVLLGRDQKLRALPLPPCIKADSFALIETWFPELRSSLEHKRFGNTVKYLPLDTAPLSPAPTYVLFPRYQPNCPGEIRILESFTGLQRLLAQCVFVPPGFQHGDVTRLLQWHAGLSYLDLALGECNAVIPLLASVAASEGKATC